MSKWSEEFIRMFPTTKKLREHTKQYKKSLEKNGKDIEKRLKGGKK